MSCDSPTVRSPAPLLRWRNTRPRRGVGAPSWNECEQSIMGWGQHFCRARETVAGRPTLSPPPRHAWLELSHLSHVSAARVTARMPIVIGFVTRVTRVTRVTPVTEVSVAGSSESNRFRNGTAAGGFMCFIVRLIARPFMSWSDTTLAPNLAGTHSYLAAVRRTDDAPESQIDCAPSRAYPAPASLRQLSRELPRWKRDHGLLHRQARRRR